MELPTEITYKDLQVRVQAINCCLAKKSIALNDAISLGTECQEKIDLLEYAYNLLGVLEEYNTNLVMIPEIDGIQTEVLYESQEAANCVTIEQMDTIFQYLADFCNMCFTEYGEIVSTETQTGAWYPSNTFNYSNIIQVNWAQTNPLAIDYIKNKSITDYISAGTNVTFTGTGTLLDPYVISSSGSGGSMVYPGTGIPLSTGSAWGTSITNNSSNWNTAYGWGNHASAGYLLSSTAASTYQPLDGDLTAIAAIAGTSGLLKKTAANTWSLDTNTYLTSYTETDTLQSVTTRGATTTTSITANSFIKTGGSSTEFLKADGSVSTGTGGGELLYLGTYNPSGDIVTSTDLTIDSGTFAALLAQYPTNYNMYLTIDTAGTFTDPITSTTYAVNIGDIIVSTKSNGFTTDQWIATNSYKAYVDSNPGSYLTGNQSISLSGDITGTGATSITTAIASNAVTYAKMQAVSATSKLLGSSSTTTPVQEITIGSGLTLTGTTLTASGSGGSTTFNGILAASGSNNSIDNTNVTNIWQWSTLGAGAADALKITSSVASGSTNYLVNIETTNAASTVQPFRVGTRGADSIIIDGTGNATLTSNTSGTTSIGNSSTTGTIKIGEALTSGTVFIGPTGTTNGTVTISHSSGTNTVNIAATTNGIKTVNIANNNGSSVTTVNIATNTSAVRVVNIVNATGKIGFFGTTAVVKQTGSTQITYTSPGTADYALQTVQLAGYGFATADEGNTLLKVVSEIQAALKAYGLMT